MNKATITRLFIGGGLAIVTGAIVSVFAIGIAMANDIFVMNGTDVEESGEARSRSPSRSRDRRYCRDHGRSDRGPARIGAPLNTWYWIARPGSSLSFCSESSTSGSSR